MRGIRIVAATAVVFLAACSGDNSQDSLLEPQLTTGSTGYVDVVKFGPAGTYNFTASATGGFLYSSSFTVDAGQTWLIWYDSDPNAATSQVTVTEVLAPGFTVDSIVVVTALDGVIDGIYKYTNTNTVTVSDLSYRRDARIKVYNAYSPPPPPGGTEGCTPGYWKQAHHFDSWVGYLPTDLFATVFGVAYSGTLLDALNSTSGGRHALARHAVAALLNASSTIDYAANTSAVISAVQAAFASGDFETQKDIFEGWNEMGCPLN